LKEEGRQTPFFVIIFFFVLLVFGGKEASKQTIFEGNDSILFNFFVWLYFQSSYQTQQENSFFLLNADRIKQQRNSVTT